MIFALGCSSPRQTTTTTTISSTSQCARTSTSSNATVEVPYCANVQTYTSSVTISGTATFQARTIDTSLVGPNRGLLSVGTSQPIRSSEIIVKDQNGSIIQCAETANDGSFSLQVPSTSNTYTLYVNSRSQNSKLNASVIVCPETHKLYSISKSFVADISKSIGTLNASATSGNIDGGAFNILEQLLKSNEYLRTQVSTCTNIDPGCSNFTVAPKVSIYWEKGFNPNSYFGSTSGSSFYIPNQRRLFILGGISGDVNQSDTDHFDNSVIIHEYAHFLEDVFTKSDSPGGPHDGMHIIDPRLAWGEGWANFFQAAVTGYPYYIDTWGNSSGTTDEYFRIDLEDQLSPIFDQPQNIDEGNFREFSISRLLWDIIDSTNDGESISNGFSDLWATLTSTNGFLHPSAAFRSVGMLHERRDIITGNSPDWSAPRGLANHRANRKNYAQWVTTTSSTCSISSTPYTITPTNISSTGLTLNTVSGGGLDSSFQNSNLLFNNDFFHFYHSGGAISFDLNYITPTGAVNADLDLYIYSSDARYGYSIDILNNLTLDEGQSQPNASLASTQNEMVTLSNLSAGHYLINVRVYTGRAANALGDLTNYELKANGVNLCPSQFPN